VAGLNLQVIIGNLGRDPELKYLANGDPVTNFSVAVTRKSKNGEETEWFNIVAFNRAAEIANEFLAKGRQVCVVGRTRTRSWDDKTTGEKKYRTEVITNDIVLLGNKGETVQVQHLSDLDDSMPF
jgi:single-strand DNA-binding protein